MHRQLRLTRPAGAILLTFGLALSACGDDGGDGESASGSDENGFCEGVLTLTAIDPGPGADATPEELQTAQQDYFDEQIVPAIEQIRTNAPEEVQDDADTLSAAVDAASTEEGTEDEPAAEEGEEAEDPPSQEEVREAQANIVAATEDECDWETVELTAADLTYEGVPETVEAGNIGIKLTNEGEDAHEALVVRRSEGVEEPFDELLQKPAEELSQLLTLVADVSPAEPGESSMTVTNLEPGEYAIIDTIPVGTTSLTEPPDPEEEPGAPHYAEGMFSTFTVE